MTALPLVLPPTVLGFYLLIFLSPTRRSAGCGSSATGSPLTFSFAGLVIGLVPLLAAVHGAAAASRVRGRGPRPDGGGGEPARAALDAFFTVAAPMAGRGFLTATVLTFAHTIGEFGVVLMVGGNIPGRTKVVSIQIYEHVETINYAAAHSLSAILLVFSFTVLLAVYTLNRRFPVHVG